MFAYDKNLSNGKLCELFIEDGNLFTDGKNIMYKRGNIYRTLPQDRVQSLLRTNMTPETRMNMSPYQLNTIIELIKQNPDIYINTDVFNTGCICFSNGIYDVSERRLKAFDDEYYGLLLMRNIRRM